MAAMCEFLIELVTKAGALSNGVSRSTYFTEGLRIDVFQRAEVVVVSMASGYFVTGAVVRDGRWV
jgi:hypothetical protein